MEIHYTEPDGFKLRVEQREAVEKILNFYAAGKIAVIVVAPTGSGKSIIAKTVASAFSSSYLLTPTKILQDQYWNDFGSEEGVALLKGKSNYICGLHDETPVDKNWCQDNTSAAKRQKNICRDEKVCPYYVSLDLAAESPCAIMNFKLFMIWMKIGTIFGKRALHVIDECHRIDDWVSDFLGISTKWNTLRHILKKFDAPIFKAPPKEDEKSVLEFLKALYDHNDRHVINLCSKFHAKNKTELLYFCEESTRIKDEAKEHLWLDQRLFYMFERLKKDPDAYGVGLTGKNKRDPKDTRDLEIIAKPVKVGGYVRTTVMGETSLFLSATLPDVNLWAKDMGLGSDEYGVVELDSIFPAKNRPIIFDTVGTIIDATKVGLYVPIAQKIDALAKKHSEHKGLIHVQSYDWSEQIASRLNLETHNRLLIGVQNALKTESLLKLHSDSSLPTIMMSPAMKEGVDLKDGLCRFQIVVKCPLGALGDPRVAKKTKQNREWYDFEAITSFMQQVGRGTRSPDDWCITYCLDKKMVELLRKSRKSLPKYFVDSLQDL